MEQIEIINDVVKDIRNISTDKRLTISVAESLTSGNIQSLLTSISGSSSFFVGGITTYNIDQKVNLLGVDRVRAIKHNCVSQYIANQMSVGCYKMFKSDISIGVTGYAEPYESENIDIPFCFYSISYKGVIISHGKIESVTKSRNITIQLFTQSIVNKIYDVLKQI